MAGGRDTGDERRWSSASEVGADDGTVNSKRKKTLDRYDQYASLAVSLSHHGRRSGGILLLVRKCFSKQIERVDVPYDQMIVLKFFKMPFRTLYDIILKCVYVPPQGNPYCNTVQCNCLIDKCVLDLAEKCGDLHLILCGGKNASTSNFFVGAEELPQQGLYLQRQAGLTE